jgi:hypothetical protein
MTKLRVGHGMHIDTIKDKNKQVGVRGGIPKHLERSATPGAALIKALSKKAFLYNETFQALI